MASIDCKFHSEVLGMASSMRVLLPEPRVGRRAERHPVLFLLHGLSDDESAWTRFSGLERYVAGLDLAVVMPNVHRSFYTNMAHGYRYWDFVSEELPFKARALFPLASEREHSFVAGLSMGGYGALRLALSKPGSFAAAASLSATCDLSNLFRHVDDLALVFGDTTTVPPGADLQRLARSVAESGGPRPKLFQACGAADPLLDENRRFRDFIAPLGFDHTYEESPGGHDWDYWDNALQRVLRWLPLA